MKALDPNNTILTDIGCHRCAYNLRGLNIGGRCPECGAPTKVAVAGDALEFADPDWLRRLTLGMTVTYYLIGPIFSIFLLAVALAYFDVQRATKILILIAFAGLVSSATIGLWLFATPNRVTIEVGESLISPRRLIRVGIVGSILTVAATFTPSLWWPLQSKLWMHLVGGPFGLIGYLGLHGLCTRCLELSERMNDSFGIHKSRQYRRGYGCAWIPTAIGTVIGLLDEPKYGALLFIPGGIGMMYFGILSFLMPMMIAKNLANHRAMAEAIWAEALAANDPPSSANPPPSAVV